MKQTTESDNGEDGLKSYYSVIKRIALLTAEEERELSSRVFSGDEEARRRLIEADPDFNGGNYTTPPALALANEFSALMLTSPAHTARKVSRAEFSKFVAKSLTDEGKRDANDRLLQLCAIIAFDITSGGSIADAARKKPVSEFIAVAANDHVVDPSPALEWAHAIHAQTFVSSGDCGHMIMECDGVALTAAILEFLAAP